MRREGFNLGRLEKKFSENLKTEAIWVTLQEAWPIWGFSPEYLASRICMSAYITVRLGRLVGFFTVVFVYPFLALVSDRGGFAFIYLPLPATTPFWTGGVSDGSS